MTGAFKLLLCSNTSDILLYKSRSKSPRSSLTYDLLWDSYFLTPQRVFGRLSSKFINSLPCPQWTLFVVMLTIYLWQFLPKIFEGDINFPRKGYDQTLFPLRELFLLSLCPVCHLWTVEILSMVSSQSVMSILPPNRQITKSHLSVQ